MALRAIGSRSFRGFSAPACRLIAGTGLFFTAFAVSGLLIGAFDYPRDASNPCGVPLLVTMEFQSTWASILLGVSAVCWWAVAWSRRQSRFIRFATILGWSIWLFVVLVTAFY